MASLVGESKVKSKNKVWGKRREGEGIRRTLNVLEADELERRGSKSRFQENTGEKLAMVKEREVRRVEDERVFVVDDLLGYEREVCEVRKQGMGGERVKMICGRRKWERADKDEERSLWPLVTE